MLTRAEHHDFFNLDPETIRDSFGYMALVREKGPVWQEPYKGVYLVTGHQDIVSILKQPDLFSSAVAIGGPFIGLQRNGRTARQMVREFRAEVAQQTGRAIGSTVLADDPPEHTRYRALLNKLFTPARMKELIPAIEKIASSLVDAFAGEDRIEFVSSFSQPLAYMTVAEMLGMPEEDRQAVIDEMMNMPSKGAGMLGTAENAAEYSRKQGIVYAEEYFERYLRDRRENPRDDQLSRLATITFPDGTQPPLNELIALSTSLFAAGQDTTRETLNGMIRYLAKNPGIADRLRANAGDIPKFVEEGLRWVSPTKILFRIALADTEIAGVSIPEGAIIGLVVMSGNHDAAVFEHPDGFMPDRPAAGRHLTFGFGIHFCIGSALARPELQIGLRVFLNRIKSFQLDESEQAQPLVSWMLNGWETLPLRIAAS